MSGTGVLVWLGALSGPGLVLGLWLVLRGLPFLAQPSLEARLVPYLPGSGQAIPHRGRWWRRTLLAAGEALGRVLGAEGPTRRRLQRAGDATTLPDFRAQQVLSGFGGVVAGTLLAAYLVAAQGTHVLVMMGLVLLGGAGGVWARDHWLTRTIRAREHRILLQFPTVAELLALSVGAGEGALGALERVSRTASGDLAAELARTLASVRAGRPLVQALDQLADRTGVPAVSRFVDGISVSLQRGTPLGDVLRAQAEDVREASRRELIELGGRKELLMMVPVVFLLLPVTVLFAVFPGVVALGMGAP